MASVVGVVVATVAVVVERCVVVVVVAPVVDSIVVGSYPCSVVVDSWSCSVVVVDSIVVVVLPVLPAYMPRLWHIPWRSAVQTYEAALA